MVISEADAEMNLSVRDCIPCKGGLPPLPPGESEKLLLELSDGWQVIDNHHLQKTVKFKNFAEALQFVNRIGAWGRASIKIWTHKIDGVALSFACGKCARYSVNHPSE